MGPRVSEDNEQGESLLPTDEKETKWLDGNYQQISKYQWVGIICLVAVSLGLGYLLGWTQGKGTSRAQYGLPSKHPSSPLLSSQHSTRDQCPRG